MAGIPNSRITGIGSFVPSKRLTNKYFEEIVDTSDEWIISRTGIKERRVTTDDETCSMMSVEAARNAMDMAGVKPEEIDLILVGTVTPDYRLPSQACVIQEKMGMINAATMDIVAACAGFLHGLSTADAFIRAGQFRRALVIGAEKLTSITNYKDRNTCVLFGDAAGAAIVEASDEDNGRGILSSFMRSDGRHGKLLWIPDGGSLNPPQNFQNGDGEYFINMNGKEVFKHAVREMADASKRVIKRAGVTADDVKLMVPHQANIRIIESTAKRLGISMEKVFLNIEKYGNTSAASVPLALDEAYQEGRFKEGDIVLMTAFGGGLTWASTLIRW